MSRAAPACALVLLLAGLAAAVSPDCAQCMASVQLATKRFAELPPWAGLWSASASEQAVVGAIQPQRAARAILSAVVELQFKGCEVESAATEVPRRRAVHEPFACPPAVVCRKAGVCSPDDVRSAPTAEDALDSDLCSQGEARPLHPSVEESAAFAAVRQATHGVSDMLLALGATAGGSVEERLLAYRGAATARLAACQTQLAASWQKLEAAYAAHSKAHQAYLRSGSTENVVLARRLLQGYKAKLAAMEQTVRLADFQKVVTAEGEKCFCPDTRSLTMEAQVDEQPPVPPPTPQPPAILLWTLGPAQATKSCAGAACEAAACSSLRFAPAQDIEARARLVVDEASRLSHAADECERSRLEVEQQGAHHQEQAAKIIARSKKLDSEVAVLNGLASGLEDQLARSPLTVEGLVASVQAALGSGGDESCTFGAASSTPGYCSINGHGAPVTAPSGRATVLLELARAMGNDQKSKQSSKSTSTGTSTPKAANNGKSSGSQTTSAQGGGQSPQLGVTGSGVSSAARAAQELAGGTEKVESVPAGPHTTVCTDCQIYTCMMSTSAAVAAMPTLLDAGATPASLKAYRAGPDAAKGKVLRTMTATVTDFCAVAANTTQRRCTSRFNMLRAMYDDRATHLFITHGTNARLKDGESAIWGPFLTPPATLCCSIQLEQDPAGSARTVPPCGCASTLQSLEADSTGTSRRRGDLDLLSRLQRLDNAAALKLRVAAAKANLVREPRAPPTPTHERAHASARQAAANKLIEAEESAFASAGEGVKTLIAEAARLRSAKTSALDAALEGVFRLNAEVAKLEGELGGLRARADAASAMQAPCISPKKLRVGDQVRPCICLSFPQPEGEAAVRAVARKSVPELPVFRADPAIVVALHNAIKARKSSKFTAAPSPAPAGIPGFCAALIKSRADDASGCALPWGDEMISFAHRRIYHSYFQTLDQLSQEQKHAEATLEVVRAARRELEVYREQLEAYIQELEQAGEQLAGSAAGELAGLQARSAALKHEIAAAASDVPRILESKYTAAEHAFRSCVASTKDRLLNGVSG